MSACVQHFAVHKGHKCIFHVFIFVTRHCCSVCCSCCSVAMPLRSDGAAQSPHKQQKTSLALRNLPLTWAGQTNSGNTRQRTCSLSCFKKRKTKKIKIIIITKCSVGMVVSIHLAQNALSAAGGKEELCEAGLGLSFPAPFPCWAMQSPWGQGFLSTAVIPVSLQCSQALCKVWPLAAPKPCC